MALTYRFYRSLMVGTGTRSDPYRSDLTRFIVADGSGANFWDLAAPAGWHPARYALAIADSTVHAAIDADGTNLALSGELVDLPTVATFLDGTDAQNLAANILAQFETDGVSTAWLASQTTVRQMLSYLSRLVVILQDVDRLANTNALAAFASALSTTVSQLSANVKTQVAAWMTGKGLDTSWIVGSTTVRQVLQYILTNINWPTLSLGPVSF